MIKNANLVLASLLIALLLAEGILQVVDYPDDGFHPWVYDEKTGFRLAPHLNQSMISSEFDVKIQTNEYGFRDDKIGEKNGVRILLLGDSFTFGYGVSRDFLFADILEHQLKAEIVNASVGGFEIIHQVKWFQTEGKHFDADLVVFGLYLGNDLSRNDNWNENQDGNLYNPKIKYPLRNRSIKIINLFRNIIYQNQYEAMQQKEWVPFPDYLTMTRHNLSEAARKKYSYSKKLLDELYADITKSGADFFVCMFPYKTVVDQRAGKRFQATLPDSHNSYDLERPSKEIESFLQDRGISYLNTIPAMKNYYKDQSNPSLFYHSDGHFTPEGHAFIAKQLGPILSSIIETKMKEVKSQGTSQIIMPISY